MLPSKPDVGLLSPAGCLESNLPRFVVVIFILILCIPSNCTWVSLQIQMTLQHYMPATKQNGICTQVTQIFATSKWKKILGRQKCDEDEIFSQGWRTYWISSLISNTVIVIKAGVRLFKSLTLILFEHFITAAILHPIKRRTETPIWFRKLERLRSHIAECQWHKTVGN